MRVKKIIGSKQAFGLAQIESNLAKEEKQRAQWELLQTGNPVQLRDGMCQKKCDEDLQLGLDMVKSHMAFGSIEMPSVIDESDHKLFCRLDDQHNWCLRNCGFTVQFNLNDFICKDHYQQMTSLLPCYRRVIPVLKRECGAKRCGPYINIDDTVIGHANRCRLLICDIECTTNVLIRHCADDYGQQAANFITNYTSKQVLFWMKDLIRELDQARATIPPSCSRLICQKSQCFS
ncbi:unnamed protein product [Litomosoides sigmodontis]|uniref:Uncharacterized protein n=1 Tax=Litomosoides sigmodontis TaxID=42156 RepID=A0A3P6TJ64_LITSI|nr:unnamed protein product [Litomosoides sigmodontis]